MHKRLTHLVFSLLLAALCCGLAACGSAEGGKTTICTLQNGDYTITLTQAGETVTVTTSSPNKIAAAQTFTFQSPAALTAQDVTAEWTSLDGTKTGDLCVAHLAVTADGQVLFQERINLNKPAMKQALS